MYNVSEEYLNAISQPVRTFKIKAQFDCPNAQQAVFDDSNIMGEVMIESQAVSGSSSCGMIDIGAVAPATATLTVIDDDANLKKYSGASFTMCVSLLLENGEYEDVPMGKFFCDTGKMSRVGNRISVFGYDAMITLNYTLTDTQRTKLTNRTAWSAVYFLVGSAKCEFDQDLSGFPNSDLMLDFSNTQIETAWGGIMWIAQLMGCFARINRQNFLEFVPVKSTWEYFDEDHTIGRIVETRTIQASERYDRTTFSDDRIHIVGVSMPDDNNKLITRGGGGSGNDSNITIALEKNPLIKSFYSIEDILDNILTQLNTAYFYAFRAEIISDPALDAGDTVRLQGGVINGTNQNNDLVGFITHNTWRYRGRHEIVNTGQTAVTDSGSTSYATPKPQSEKVLNSISGSTNQLKGAVDIIDKRTANGIDRARYLQTSDAGKYDPATVLRTMHVQEIVGRSPQSNEGAVGFEFSEKNDPASLLPPSRIKGTMQYTKETGIYTHPIKHIHCKLCADPSDMAINNSRDQINMEAYGYSYGANQFNAYGGITFDGLWVSGSTDNLILPRDVKLFYARFYHTSSEYKQEFTIANVEFSVTDDGITIRRPHTSLHPNDGYVFIPWSNADGSGTSAQAEAHAVEASSGGEPSYTYDDDGIHINFNGHTKVIPWDT